MPRDERGDDELPMTIRSAISKKRFQSGVFSSFSSSLGPYWLRRRDASAALRPLSPSEDSSFSTSSDDERYSFNVFPSWVDVFRPTG